MRRCGDRCIFGDLNPFYVIGTVKRISLGHLDGFVCHGIDATSPFEHDHYYVSAKKSAGECVFGPSSLESFVNWINTTTTEKTFTFHTTRGETMAYVIIKDGRDIAYFIHTKMYDEGWALIGETEVLLDGDGLVEYAGILLSEIGYGGKIKLSEPGRVRMLKKLPEPTDTVEVFLRRVPSSFIDRHMVCDMMRHPKRYYEDPNMIKFQADDMLSMKCYAIGADTMMCGTGTMGFSPDTCIYFITVMVRDPLGHVIDVVMKMTDAEGVLTVADMISDDTGCQKYELVW